MAIIAASMANRGKNPLTGKKIFEEETVAKALSLMSSCGMYDYSGQWAFSIGIPAKSGVSGCIFLVIPNVLGVCIESPPLDERGNSYRGIEFCKLLLKEYTLHRYDNLKGVCTPFSNKKNLLMRRKESRINFTIKLLQACADDNLHELQSLLEEAKESNFDINQISDYD